MQGWFNTWESTDKIHYNNSMKKKHIIISINTENTSDKIQHSDMIKITYKPVIVGNYLNIIKAICEKLTANIISDCEKLKAFPPISGTRQVFCFFNFYST